MTNLDLESLLRSVGARLSLPEGPPPDLAGKLPQRSRRMDLDHLHLGVRDLDASAAFYARWFGLTGEVIDGTLFARNEHGFLLCLTPTDNAPPLNAHFGFTLPDSRAVRALRDEMVAANVVVDDVYEEPGYASFRVADPDGTFVEVFAE